MLVPEIDVFSSSTFTIDAQQLKKILESTAHRYLVVCAFFTLAAPFAFSTIHFVSRRHREALIKLAVELDSGQCDFSCASQHGLNSSVGEGAFNTSFFMQGNGQAKVSTDVMYENREGNDRDVILQLWSTFPNPRHFLSTSSNIARYEADNVSAADVVYKHSSHPPRTGYGRSAAVLARLPSQLTAVTNTNGRAGNYSGHRRGTLRGDFLLNCAFASVSVSYFPMSLQTWKDPEIARRNARSEGTLSTENYYLHKGKRLISWLCEYCSQLFVPLTRVILAKQRTTGEEFACSVAKTATTFLVRKAACSLCCMVARDTAIHVYAFFVSRMLSPFISFFHLSVVGTGEFRVAPTGASFPSVWRRPSYILGTVGGLVRSLVQDPIFSSPLSDVSLKLAQIGALDSSGTSMIDSLLGLYVFVMSADSPTVRCCLPLWLMPVWRLLLLLEWIGRPAATVWVQPQFCVDETSGTISTYCLADEVWQKLTPKGYFVCMLLYSLPEVAMRFFPDCDWWSLLAWLRQTPVADRNSINTQTCTSGSFFRQEILPIPDKNAPLHEGNTVDMDSCEALGKRGQKSGTVYRFPGVAFQRLPHGVWQASAFLYDVCATLRSPLLEALVCFIVLSLLPRQATEAVALSARSASLGLPFYLFGCLRGAAIAGQWIRSKKSE